MMYYNYFTYVLYILFIAWYSASSETLQDYIESIQLKESLDKINNKETSVLQDQRTNTNAKTVLITGGAGFVGRHLTKSLCALQWHVIIVDNMISKGASHIDNWPEHLKPENCTIQFHEMDCRDYFLSRQSSYNFNLFIHLAAIETENVTISYDSFSENVAIDTAAFKFAANERSRPDRMIYFSAATVNYSILQERDDKKLHGEGTLNLFKLSKLTGEKLAQLASKEYGLNVSIYRPTTIYGEDQHISYPFSTMLHQKLQGSDLASDGGQYVHDFIHIDDIVDCVMISVDKLNPYEVIDIGSGVATSLFELGQEMVAQIGFSANVANTSYDRNFTNFHPMKCKNKISLQEGISRTIKYAGIKTIVKNDSDISSAKKSTKQYSSMSCTGSNQHIHCSQFSKLYKDFPRANHPRVKTCKFQNVCFINGNVIFYADNTTSRNLFNPDSFPLQSKLLHRTFSSNKLWSPIVINASVPEYIPFSTKQYALFYETSHSYNFGHFLIDDMMPVFFAMDMFDILETDMSLYVENFCNASSIYPFTVSEKDRCIKIYRSLFHHIFDTDKLTMLGPTDQVCFKNLIVGHTSAFSLRTLELARSGFIRRFRNRVVERAGLTHLLNLKSKIHKIIVLVKDDGGYSQLAPSSYLRSRLCNIVKNMATHIYPTPEVICISNIASISFQTQLELSLTATVVISEHGTLSYFTIFTRTGTAGIVISPLEEGGGVKESNILLHTTHYQVFYLRSFGNSKDEDLIFEKDFYMTFLHSLYITSDHFKMDMVVLKEYSATMSNRLEQLCDHTSAIDFNDGHNNHKFHFFHSQDRCTTTYRWCWNQFNDTDVCELVYNITKSAMKFYDDMNSFDCSDGTLN